MLDRKAVELLLRVPPWLRRYVTQGLLAGTLAAGSLPTALAQAPPPVELGRPRPMPAPQYTGPIQQAVFLQPPQPGDAPEGRAELSVDAIVRIEQSDWTRPSPGQERMRREIAAILEGGSPARQAGAIAMLADAAEQLRKQKLTSPGYPRLWMTTFTEPLMRLAVSGQDPYVRRQAARALAMVQFDPDEGKPKPKDIAAVLKQLTDAGNPPAVRLAGIASLTLLAQTINHLHSYPSPFQLRYDATVPGEGRRPPDEADQDRTLRQQEDARREKWWQALQQGRMAVVEAASEVLFTQDTRLQREALQAMTVVVEDLLIRTSAYTSDDTTTTTSAPIVEDPLLHRTLLTTDEAVRQGANRLRFIQLVEKLEPMLKVLEGVIPALARRAGGSQDQAVIASSMRALESLARLRWQIYVAPDFPHQQPKPEVAPPPRRGVLLPSPPPEPVAYRPEVPVAIGLLPLAQERDIKLPADRFLKSGLEAAFPELRRLLGHPNATVRRGAVDVIESMGDMAEPLIPDLVRALGDRDQFVRWAAARTLGRMAPQGHTPAVAGLVGLLTDQDIGVRSAAARALRRFGEHAAGAVPAIAASIQRGDADYRVEGIRALQAVGQGAAPAVPALVMNLQHTDYRVRRAAANTLGGLGPLAASAAPALRQLLTDENEEVRRAASEATLNVTAPQ